MAFWNKKKNEQDKPNVHAKDADTSGQAEPQVPTVSVPNTGDSQSFDAILGPHITEKASVSSEMGKYVFRVKSGANKIEIRRSIEKLYNVTVRNVHIIRMPEKKRQVGRYMGTKAGYKKAVVTLKPGDKIDIVA